MTGRGDIELDEPAPPTRADRDHGVRRADIQGLRAVAVAIVVGYHAGLHLPGGFIGVDLFFVISGFVITTMLWRELGPTGSVGFVSFYTRRMRRILPALALLIVAVAVASVFLLSPLGPQTATAKTGIAASLFGANIELLRAGGPGYFDLSVETNALLHTWSLSVEEQFYLAFPAFLLLAWKLGSRFGSRFGSRLGHERSRRRGAFVVVGLATVASFALCAFTTYRPGPTLGMAFAFYSSPTRAWEFGAGVLVALAAPTLSRLPVVWAAAFGYGGALLVAIAVFTITPATAFPGFAAVLPVAGAALLLVAGMRASRGINSLLGLRPAVWIGDLSYGWYLWHWPIIVFAAAAWPGNRWVLMLAAAGSLLPTWLSYRFVEHPIRVDNRITGRRVVTLIAICVVVPIVACLSLVAVNRVEKNSAAVQALDRNARPPGRDKAGCTNRSVPLGERDPADCTWSVANPRGTIFLVGDSNAAQFTEPATAAANQLGYDLTVVALPSCPFVDLEEPKAGYDAARCNRFVTETVTALVARQPALVILASSSSTDVNSRAPFRDPHTGETATTADAKATMWEQGQVRVLTPLADARIPTLLIHTVPHLDSLDTEWHLTACPAVRIYTRSCADGAIDRTRVERQQLPARQAEDRAVAAVPAVTAVDFTDDLCTADACPTTRDGVILYRDSQHLSIPGATTLTDRFAS